MKSKVYLFSFLMALAISLLATPVCAQIALQGDLGH